MQRLILVLLAVCVLMVGCEMFGEVFRSDSTGKVLDDAGKGVGAVATVLPPPWNLVAAGAGGLLIAGLKAWRNKLIAKTLVKRLEAAKNGGTIVDFASPAAKEAMAAVPNPAADKLVDAIQAGKRVLPF